LATRRTSLLNAEGRLPQATSRSSKDTVGGGTPPPNSFSGNGVFRPARPQAYQNTSAAD